MVTGSGQADSGYAFHQPFSDIVAVGRRLLDRPSSSGRLSRHAEPDPGCRDSHRSQERQPCLGPSDAGVEPDHPKAQDHDGPQCAQPDQPCPPAIHNQPEPGQVRAQLDHFRSRV